MKLRYIVVDDAPFLRELIKGLMSSWGHLCVGEAAEASEALDVISRTLPDMIFLDLVMPKKNGAEAAKEIRELWPESKIIACTTLEQSDIKPAQMEYFDAWLSKPFSKQQVEEVIQQLQIKKGKPA